MFKVHMLFLNFFHPLKCQGRYKDYRQRTLVAMTNERRPVRSSHLPIHALRISSCPPSPRALNIFKFILLKATRCVNGEACWSARSCLVESLNTEGLEICVLPITFKKLFCFTANNVARSWRTFRRNNGSEKKGNGRGRTQELHWQWMSVGFSKIYAIADRVSYKERVRRVCMEQRTEMYSAIESPSQDPSRQVKAWWNES